MHLREVCALYREKQYPASWSCGTDRYVETSWSMSMCLDLSSTIARAREGHPQAIGDLYDVYAARIQHYCYVRLGNRQAAEDCVQEVFISIWKALPAIEYRGESAFMGWMYTITYHEVVTYIRRAKHRVDVSLTPDAQLVDLKSVDVAGKICDGEALRDALTQLTADQLRVITLRFFGGLSTSEVAEALDRTDGAIKLLQHRAINRLQHLLAINEDRPCREHKLTPTRLVNPSGTLRRKAS